MHSDLSSTLARSAPRPPASRSKALANDRVVAHHLRGSSLNRALDVVGDWWTQRILRECFLGVHNFEGFQRRLGIPRQTLALRLRALVGHDLLSTARGGYRLTERGLALYPWALLIWRWTRTWSDGAMTGHPPVLVHRDCGHAMTPVFACGKCGEAVTVRDVEYRDAPGARMVPPLPAGVTTRWAGGRFVKGPVEGGRHSAFVTADRWTHLIISAVFLGCRSFERIEREMGIAPNILAQRLALLVAGGFLDKRKSAEDARRFIYALTERGRDVFPLTIALVQWADRWLPIPGGPPMRRIHRSCGSALRAVVVCSHCAAALKPQRVSFQSAPGTPAADAMPSRRPR